jgi:hypothetical protein
MLDALSNVAGGLAGCMFSLKRIQQAEVSK